MCKGNKGGFMGHILRATRGNRTLSITSSRFKSPADTGSLTEVVLCLVSAGRCKACRMAYDNMYGHCRFTARVLHLTKGRVRLESIPARRSSLSSIEPPCTILSGFVLHVVRICSVPS